MTSITKLNTSPITAALPMQAASETVVSHGGGPAFVADNQDLALSVKYIEKDRLFKTDPLKEIQETLPKPLVRLIVQFAGDLDLVFTYPNGSSTNDSVFELYVHQNLMGRLILDPAKIAPQKSQAILMQLIDDVSKLTKRIMFKSGCKSFASIMHCQCL